MRTLTLTLVATVITATIGLGYIISWVYSEFYAKSEFSEEHKAYQNISQQLSTIVQYSEAPNAMLEQWNMSGNIHAQLEDRDTLLLPQQLEENFKNGEVIALEFDDSVKFYSLINHSDKILTLTPPALTQESTPVENLAFTFIFYTGVIFAITLWLLPLFTRLRLLDNTAKNFGDGNLAARLPECKISYIKNIELAFNTMAERIQRLIEDNKMLSRAVSHDLKTPLARLRFGLETLQEEEREDKRKAYHARIHDDLDTMESLVHTLLDYAKLDDTHIALDKKPINLCDFITAEASQLTVVHSTAITITLAIAPAGIVMVCFDEHYLRMIFQNLVINAINHANGHVKLCVYADSGYAFFAVEDDGSGVSTEDKARIFKPFERGEKPNVKLPNAKGHGMGLAICERVGQWFSAEILLDRSAELKGASFILKVPLLPSC